MDKNYYEILEIDKNASQEIIEKAYKTLVKKYHPDLQENSEKSIFEEKIKDINEAYDVLSDPEKRKNYDTTLKNLEDEYNEKLYNENQNLKNEINYLRQNQNNQANRFQDNNQINNNTNNFENEYNTNNQFDYYTNNNIKKNWKDLLALLLTIIFLCLLGLILWAIPFTRNYFIDLYNTNDVLKILVNSFRR